MARVGQVNQGAWCQETYDTASRDAGRRARQLRRLGYDVRVSSLGPQVTQYGIVRCSLVDVRPGTRADTSGLPEAIDGKAPVRLADGAVHWKF